MRRFSTGILIRNNRLKLMEDNGLKVKYEILNDTQYVTELKKKLIEEAEEVLDATTEEELKFELIDLLEIIEHIAEIHKIDKEDLDIIKAEKQKKVGKFDNKIKTHYIEMPEGHEELEYYLSKPHKYPEIK